MAGKPPEVKILGDASGASKAAKDAADALEHLGDEADKTSTDVEGLGKESDKTDGKLGGLGRAADGTRGKINDFGDDLKNSLGPAGEVAGGAIDKVTGFLGKMPPVALAATGGVAALGAGLVALAASSVTKLSDTVAEMEMLRSKSGASLEEVSRLAFAMDRLGVSTDDLDEVMEEWGAGLQENIPALEAMGVQIKRNADGTVNSDQTFRSFLSTLRSVEDPARRMAMANEIIGESAYRIEPAVRASEQAFNDFYDAADEAGAVISDLDAAQVRELQIASKDLRQAWESIQLQLARGVTPALAEFLGNIADVAEGLVALESKTKILGTSLSILTAPMGLVSDGLEAVGLSGGDAEVVLEDVKTATDDAGQAAQDRAADLEAEEAAERSATQATEERIDAARRAVDQSYALSAATRDVQQAQLDETAAQEALTAAVQAHGPESAQAQQAALRLQAASDAVQRSFIDQAQAQAALTISQRTAAGETLSAVEKNNIFIGNLQALANSLAPGSPVRNALEGHIATLNAVPTYIETRLQVYREIADLNTGSNFNLAGLAKGGPARAGEPYVVGEEGPELFIPKSSGTVVPNDQSFGGGGGMGGGSPFAPPPVVVQVQLDKKTIAEAVVEYNRSRR